MSEALGLGATDAESRWIGVRRHQAMLVIVGLALAGDWATRPHRLIVEGVAAIICLASAIPMHDGMTGAELSGVAMRFLCRSRWTSVVFSVGSEGVMVDLGERVTLRGYELVHRGRLDLSGRDWELAEGLATFADGLATGDRTRHFSSHTWVQCARVRTLLAIPSDVRAPTGWRENNVLAMDVAGASRDGGAALILERWTYVRRSNEVIRVLRVRDFSAAPDGRAVLDQMQVGATPLDVALHVEVIGGARAQRLAARAVHRVGSDDATTQAAGFRRTARSVRSLDRLRQREMLVAGGRSLLRIAVYFVVRAPDPDQLRINLADVTRRAREAGLRCERGIGRQAPWYRQQLPGGPGW
jgi:hypothetical protein